MQMVETEYYEKIGRNGGALSMLGRCRKDHKRPRKAETRGRM